MFTIKIERNLVVQILGSLMNCPVLFTNTELYSLSPDDFEHRLDKYIYATIYNLYVDGAEKISSKEVAELLKLNPAAKTLFDSSNGLAFLQDCETQSESDNFLFYYTRLKKFNLMKDLQSLGYKIEEIYPENPFDENYSAKLERFEQMKIVDIINHYRVQFGEIENKYAIGQETVESKAADNIKDLIASLKENPEIGCSLQGEIFNSVTRGARKGTVFLRSAATGLGKSRSMVGDACSMAYPIRYDNGKKQWVSTGPCEKILYVMTEQSEQEIQAMILANLTNLNEELFKIGNFSDSELKRIDVAIDVMEKYEDNFRFAKMPDPCGAAIKNLFRKNNLQFGIEHFFYDYIFSSPAMLAEYRDLGLAEHVCLRLLTTTIKNLAIELESFIMTSTQTSMENNIEGFKDQRCIQGSKAIPQLVDFGCILSRPTKEELTLIGKVKNPYNLTPNVVCDVYKNRSGRWTMIRIWSYQDLGTCRKIDLFITNAHNQPVEDFKLLEFKSSKRDENEELLNLYNVGEVSSEIEKQYYCPENEVNQILEDFDDKAFGGKIERTKRLENVSLGDFF